MAKKRGVVLQGVDNPIHTMKLRYSFPKVVLAQNITGEVSFRVAKKGSVGWSATKNLAIFT